MAKSISPFSIASSTSGLRSNVAIFCDPFAAATASRAAVAMFVFSAMMASMVGSEMSLFWMAASVPAMSRTPVVATLKRSTSPVNVSAMPSARSSRPTLPSS